MLDLLELRELYRRLSDTPTATVFLDGSRRDPAERTAWRRAYQFKRDRLLSKLEQTDPGGAAAARSAFFHVDEAVRAHQGFLPSASWAGFASAEGLEWEEAIPVPVPLYVTWRKGPFVTPYLPALGIGAPLLLATVDHSRGEIHAYEKGLVVLKETFELEETFEAPVGVGVIKSVSGATGFRGFPAKDAAQAALSGDRGRMFDEVRGAISGLVGDDGWVFLSAPPDVQNILGRGFGSDLRARVLEGGFPDFSLSASERVDLAQSVVRTVRQARVGPLLDQIANDRGPAGRGVSGRPDTLKALSRGSVSVLLVSDALVREAPNSLEPLVREALATGADVLLCEEAAGDRLSSEGHGVAAQLRFPI